MADDEFLQVLSSIDREGLIETIRSDARFTPEILATTTIEWLGNRLLPETIDGRGTAYASWPKYWVQLKNEFRILICTSDRKYYSLRKQLSAAGQKSHATIVSSIAAVMASQFGVVAGVLVPFCALLLLAMLKLGKEAFCVSAHLDFGVEER